MKNIYPSLGLISWARSKGTFGWIAALGFALIIGFFTIFDAAKIPFVSDILNKVYERPLPASSSKKLTVAIVHIDGDQNDEVQKMIVHSLIDVPGFEVVRFDRHIDILTTDDPSTAEENSKKIAKKLLIEAQADLLIWGYVLADKEKTVRVMLSPRLVDTKFDTKIPSDLAAEFPVSAHAVFESAVKTQILAYVSQIDPSKYVYPELEKLISKLELAIKGWPNGAGKASMQISLGSAYHVYASQTGDIAALKKAATYYQEAVDHTDDVMVKSEALNQLGATQRELGERLQDEPTLQAAIDSYKKAMQYISASKTPLAWGSLNSNIGIIQNIISKIKINSDISRQSIISHKAALTVFSRENDPENWALIQMSLGNSLTTLGGIEKSEPSLQEALFAYNKSLIVNNKKDHPYYWAMVKNNLAATYLSLADVSKNKHYLFDARNELNDALQVYSKSDTPLYWGMAKHNLGLIAYQQAMLEHDVGKLNEANDLYIEALSARTKDRSPGAWSETEFALAESLATLGAVVQDKKILRQAAESYKLSLTVKSFRDEMAKNALVNINEDLNK